MQTADDVKAALAAVADNGKAPVLQRFFKTGPGEYGEGDRFLGVTVPNQRKVVRGFRKLPLPEALKLLRSPFHEHRLTALLILVELYKRADADGKQAVFDAYLAHLKHVNNWDLVDSSAHLIVGPHIQDKPRPLLGKLARSKDLWERRVAMLSTFHFIRNGEGRDALWVAEILLQDDHDLIHKAVGWMLREVGDRVDRAALLGFLDAHAARMPRTMLRYALEKLSAPQKKRYMGASAAARRAG